MEFLDQLALKLAIACSMLVASEILVRAMVFLSRRGASG
jgi:hypothetical protein